MIAIRQFLLIGIFGSLLATSCVKDELKIPTQSGIRFDLNRSPSNTGHLQFHYGELRLASLSMDCDRVEGEDIYFEREFANGLLVLLDSNVAIPEFDFEIPQGNYSEIDVVFNTFDDLGQNTIVVEGTFVNSSSQSIPLRFEFMSSEYFSLQVNQSASGGNIIMDQSSISKFLFKLDPIYWFDIVPFNMLENATITNLQGVNTLLINESVNANIHDLVADRIDEALEGIVYL